RTGELGTALVLLAGFGVAAALAGSAGRALLDVTRYYLEQAGRWQPDPGSIQALFMYLVLQTGLVVGPMMLVAALVGAFSQIVQVGFVVSGEPLKPRLDRINPIAGLQRIFSRRALVDLVRSVGLGSDFDGIDSTPIGLEDVSRLPALTEALLARGYDEASVEKDRKS